LAHTNEIGPSLGSVTEDFSRLRVHTAKVRPQLFANARQDASHLLLRGVGRRTVLSGKRTNLALDISILRPGKGTVQACKAAFQDASKLLTARFGKVRRLRYNSRNTFAKFWRRGNLRHHVRSAVKLLAETARDVGYSFATRRNVRRDSFANRVKSAVANGTGEAFLATIPRAANSRPEDWRTLSKVLNRLSKPASALSRGQINAVVGQRLYGLSAGIRQDVPHIGRNLIGLRNQRVRAQGTVKGLHSPANNRLDYRITNHASDRTEDATNSRPFKGVRGALQKVSFACAKAISAAASSTASGQPRNISAAPHRVSRSGSPNNAGGLAKDLGSHTGRTNTASKRARDLTSTARQRHLLRVCFINPAHQVEVLTIRAAPITIPAAARSTVQRSNRVLGQR
jgi:hypothetical protein